LHLLPARRVVSGGNSSAGVSATQSFRLTSRNENLIKVIAEGTKTCVEMPKASSVPPRGEREILVMQTRFVGRILTAPLPPNSIETDADSRFTLSSPICHPWRARTIRMITAQLP